MKDFRKYTKIYTLGHEENKDIFLNPDDRVIVQEKIDGGNFRFYVKEDGTLLFGSRRQQLGDDEGKEIFADKEFMKTIEFVQDKLSDIDMKDYAKKIFYGESCHKHTLPYDWVKIPRFLLFDIFDLEQGEFVPYDEVVKTVEKLGFKMPQLVYDGKVNDLPEINDEFVPQTEYPSPSSDVKQAEGVVIKNQDNKLYAKYVRDEFKERNQKTFGGNSVKYNKTDDTDNVEFVHKYCTDARIEKVVYKLLDEGNKLEMKLMGQLIKETYLDIIEENWKEILTSNWKLSFKNIRKIIAKRCVQVLKKMMKNIVL